MACNGKAAVTAGKPEDLPKRAELEVMAKPQADLDQLGAFFLDERDRLDVAVYATAKKTSPLKYYLILNGGDRK
jgi:hypothetical protein